MLISNAYAQTATTAGPLDSVMQFLPIILMCVIFYFLMYRPQQKKAKEQRAMLDAVSKGDEVVTHSGIAGRLTKVNDDYVALEIAEGVEVRMQKQSVSMVLPKGTLKNL